VNILLNHMYQIGNDICDELKFHLPFTSLYRCCAKKYFNLSPSQAQTGPAIRRRKTIAAQGL
jgi:hypothetical protein